MKPRPVSVRADISGKVLNVSVVCGLVSSVMKYHGRGAVLASFQNFLSKAPFPCVLKCTLSIL